MTSFLLLLIRIYWVCVCVFFFLCVCVREGVQPTSANLQFLLYHILVYNNVWLGIFSKFECCLFHLTFFFFFYYLNEDLQGLVFIKVSAIWGKEMQNWTTKWLTKWTNLYISYFYLSVRFVISLNYISWLFMSK